MIPIYAVEAYTSLRPIRYLTEKNTMTTIILANDQGKTIEYTRWEAIATQYGTNAEAMPEDWDEEILVHMGEGFHAVKTLEELDALIGEGYIEF